MGIPINRRMSAARFEQRHGILFALFAIWVLSIPFRYYSVIATYSVDNLLAPVLCLLAVFLPRQRDRRIVRHRLRCLSLMVVMYLLVRMIGVFRFFGSPDFLMQQLWFVLRDGFYFLVPALYLRDLHTFRLMKKLVLWLAVVGAISVFLVAIGMLNLGVERFAESRLGEGGIEKSIGLFSNYGDMSILYGFAAALLVSHGPEEMGLLGRRPVKLFIWGALFLGFIGAQSRNMLIGFVTSLVVYWTWNRIQNVKGKQRTTFVAAFVVLAIILPGIVAVFGDLLINIISNLGGKSAEHTAIGRLESYSQALSLIAKEPFGVSFSTYRQWAPLVEGIHNMWLKILLNSGVIGIFAMGGLFWLGYKGARKKADKLLFQSEPAVVMASLATIFVAVEFYGGQSDIMWVILGTLISFGWVRLQSETPKAQS